MNQRNRRHPFVLLGAAIASLGFAGQAIAQTGDQALDFALAERFALYADEAVANPDAPEPILREAAAILDLSRQLKPREVRFARSSADVLLRLGERDRALAALQALRTLDPKDQLAMIQFVDLTADKMETGEAKVAYLKQIADAVGIAPEVRSHAASSLMNAYFERSQDAQGLEAMSQAISLNPQNLVALRVKYDVAASSGVVADRAKALAGIVQASPADPANLIGMAQECAAAGDYENASFYYNVGLNVLSGAGQPPPIDDFIDFVAVQMLANQSAAIEVFVGMATQRLPNEPRLYALQLMLAMTNGKTDVELASQINAARGVYLAQLATMSQALNEPANQTLPTTAPAVPYPNVTADAAKLTAPDGDPSNLRGSYAIALAEQIWFDAYFRAARVEPAAIEALRGLVGDPNDPLVVRLEGWSLLAANRVDEAVVKLSAIADRDGYAKLGLAVAAQAKGETEKANGILTELATNRPTGMYGATVALAVKKAGLTPPEMTPAERQIAGLAGSLKNPISNLLNNPRSTYLLSARPLTISTPWGEPMLVEARILNNGSQPITVGPGGLIAPRFAVDVAMRGQGGKVFPATVVGQWTGPVRILPQQQVVQIIRIDRGPFQSYLRAYPTMLFSMTGSLTINPMIGETGSYNAPGGQQTPIGSGFERKPSPLHVESFRTQLIERSKTGSTVERLNAMELMMTVVPMLATQAENATAREVGQALATAYQEAIAKEPSPEVKALATLTAARGQRDAFLAAVNGMIDSDSPVLQAAGLWESRAIPSAERKAIAQRMLARKPQGLVLELATALNEQEDLPLPPAATQPATAPQ